MTYMELQSQLSTQCPFDLVSMFAWIPLYVHSDTAGSKGFKGFLLNTLNPLDTAGHEEDVFPLYLNVSDHLPFDKLKMPVIRCLLARYLFDVTQMYCIVVYHVYC